MSKAKGQIMLSKQQDDSIIIIRDDIDGSQSKKNRQNLKLVKQGHSTKWSHKEHALYLIFLDGSRQKTKSKLIRRSNAFFKQMELFIRSKTNIQCRSHHQKYEARYKYPHRIIKEEKQKIDAELYEALQSQFLACIGPQKQKKIPHISSSKPMIVKSSKDVQCQTDLKGVNSYINMTEDMFKVPWLTNINQYLPPFANQNILQPQRAINHLFSGWMRPYF